MPATVVKPGTFVTETLDQRRYWIGTDGYKYTIDSLSVEDCEWALDYSLANAGMLRERWAIGKLELYDTEERPRMWMLKRPAIRALMAQIVKTEGEENVGE